MCKHIVVPSILVLVLLLAGPAVAQITYVDAVGALDPNVPANTFLTTGEDFLPVDVGSGGSGVDGLWRIRGGFSNGGTIIESRGDWGADNSEDCPRLVTSVDVPEGRYEVYAYMWTGGGAAWRLGASLTDDADELPAYLCNDPNGAAILAAEEDFGEPVPIVAEADRTMWMIPLGTTVVDVNGAITVYIDDVLADMNEAGGGNARTWYDGIGYQPAGPGITYVDATGALDPNVPANTLLATGEDFLPVDVGSGGSGVDGLWRIRGGFSNGGTIIESRGDWGADNSEDCPRLMTFAIVPEGRYDVYAYMWTAGGENYAPWRIGASLTDDVNELPAYVCGDPNGAAVLAGADDFEAPVPIVTEGDRTMWQIPLGTTGVTDMITVYVDDVLAEMSEASGGNARTWYDGIGYKPAAAITYVDATGALDPNVPANTFLTTGEDFLPVDVGSGGSGVDGLWRIRGGFSNGGTILESRGDWGADNSEDCPRLMTLVDVPVGDYQVYAYMWTAGGENYAPWRMGASLTDGGANELPAYVCGDPNGAATLAVADGFAEPVPLVTEGDRTMWQIPLGATGLTRVIAVYVDDVLADMAAAGGGNARTWYDGIGYKADE